MKIFRDPVVARGQVYLLPPSVEEFVPQESPARIVGEIIEGMDSSGLVSKYTGGGAPAYDPWMMMKVLVFGYSQGIRSSRKLGSPHTYRTTARRETRGASLHTMRQGMSTHVLRGRL